MQKLKTGRTYANISISFPPDLLEQAKARAERIGLPFSTYVQKCIEKDLKERGAIVFEEGATMKPSKSTNKSPMPNSPPNIQFSDEHIKEVAKIIGDNLSRGGDLSGGTHIAF